MITIDVYDFYDDMNSSERQEMAKLLVDEIYAISDIPIKDLLLEEDERVMTIRNLARYKHLLSVDEENQILTIANKVKGLSA